MKLIMENWKKHLNESTKADYNAKVLAVIENVTAMVELISEIADPKTPVNYLSTGDLRKFARDTWNKKIGEDSRKLEILQKLVSDLNNVARSLTH